MLSYQHSYHAGNFADVHKHFTLTLMLKSLNKKPKPWSYFETHSGTAVYDLMGENALKTDEFKQGIAKVYSRKLPELFDEYLQIVKEINNGSDALDLYPGSPWIASQFAAEDNRETDQISLMELHPSEYKKLKSVFKQVRNVGVHHRDGYEGVLGLLPPKPNRGVVLIDPSYEVKDEFLQVASFVTKAYQKWSNGCFAIWYPLLKAGHHKAMLHKLKFSGIRSILKSEFHIKDSSDERMYGSGMSIVNPPWHLENQLQEGCEALFPYLSEKSALKPSISWLVTE